MAAFLVEGRRSGRGDSVGDWASCLVKGNTPTPNYSEALAASASNWADCMDAIGSPMNEGIFTIPGQNTRHQNKCGVVGDLIPAYLKSLYQMLLEAWKK